MTALLTALPPQAPGRRPVVSHLTIDAAFLRRAMVILATVVPGTVRSIQGVLELLLERHRTVGTISQTLTLFEWPHVRFIGQRGSW